MIYLDANATTPPDPAVIEAMLPFLTQHYGNPSAMHAMGRQARRAVERARGQTAALIGAEASEITFTSGATESINSTLLSAQHFMSQRPLLIVSAAEHPATLESAARWATQGGQVAHAPVFPNGLLDLNAFQSLLNAGKTALVSILWANNETGVIQPMDVIARMAHEAGALVHADAVQLVGKIPVDVRASAVDYLSLSGHKMHAPKGIGALFVSRDAPFHPLIVGGGQENERRSGTENVPGIVALGKAAELAAQRLADPAAAPAELRDRLERQLIQSLPDIQIHGSDATRLPNTSSVHFPGVEGAALLIRLDQKGLACSGGSACHGASLHPFHVLEAMGYDAAHAGSTLRLSLSHRNRREEIETAASIITAAVQHLRQQWDPSQMVELA